MTQKNRRSFLQKGVTGLAGASFFPAILTKPARSANDTLQIAIIGLNGFGIVLARKFIESGRAQIVALCDVDQQVLDGSLNQIGYTISPPPKKYTDFRNVLDDPEVEAVVIATPDHWHAIMAIMACQADKDVYLEKPCAHNVNECITIAQAAKVYNRIVQQGTQQLSGNHFKEAKDYIASGALGKIGLVRTWGNFGRGSIGKKPVTDPPAHVDYDFWLGPAPDKPFTENRFHYNWRFMWDYGSGDVGNLGVHMLDTALWSLNLTWPERISAQGGLHVYEDDKETPDTLVSLYQYPNLTLMWELRMWSNHPFDGWRFGITYYGQNQTLFLSRDGWRVYDKDGVTLLKEELPTDDLLVKHTTNFVESVHTREAPASDIASGHISSSIALLGNASFLAGKDIRYDPQQQTLDDPELNHLLTRTYRDKWPLPKVTNNISGWQNTG